MTDPLDLLLSRLDGVKQSGERYVARCPAHQDKSPSLSLSRGKDGRALIHCHAGCEARDVLAAVGMEMRDLFPDSLSTEQRLQYRREALERERHFERLIIQAAKGEAANRLSDGDLERLALAQERIDLLDRQLADIGSLPAQRQAALHAVTIEDVMNAKLEKVSHSVRPWMPRRHVTLFGGHGGIGKSSLALAICAHVACGRPFAGMEVEESMALFVSLEDEAMIVRLRLRRIIETFKLPPEKVLANLRVLDGTEGSAALMTEGDGYNAAPVFTPAFAELISQAEGMRLIVIDNASDAFDANENSRRDVRLFIRGLAALARKQDAAVVLLAHIDKASAKAGAGGNSYSGSTAWHNSTRSRLALLEQDGRIVLAHEKANLGQKADPVTLTCNDVGVLVPSAAMVDLADPDLQATFDARDVYSVLRLAVESGIDVPTATRGTSTTWHALELLPELPELYRSGPGRKRFNAALMRLFREGRIVKETYPKPNSKWGERWMMASETGENQRGARAEVAGKTFSPLSPIPPSETGELGKRCASSSVLSLAETGETGETGEQLSYAASFTSNKRIETGETGETNAHGSGQAIPLRPSLMPAFDETDAEAV